MTAARRLAAILAADVVGYSRLMGQDEAGTAKAAREGHEASTPIVAGHGGHIVKTTGAHQRPKFFALATPVWGASRLAETSGCGN